MSSGIYVATAGAVAALAGARRHREQHREREHRGLPRRSHHVQGGTRHGEVRRRRLGQRAHRARRLAGRRPRRPATHSMSRSTATAIFGVSSRQRHALHPRRQLPARRSSASSSPATATRCSATAAADRDPAEHDVGHDRRRRHGRRGWPAARQARADSVRDESDEARRQLAVFRRPARPPAAIRRRCAPGCSSHRTSTSCAGSSIS